VAELVEVAKKVEGTRWGPSLLRRVGATAYARNREEWARSAVAAAKALRDFEREFGGDAAGGKRKGKKKDRGVGDAGVEGASAGDAQHRQQHQQQQQQQQQLEEQAGGSAAANGEVNRAGKRKKHKRSEVPLPHAASHEAPSVLPSAPQAEGVEEDKHTLKEKKKKSKKKKEPQSSE
jgi:hypothetical protein